MKKLHGVLIIAVGALFFLSSPLYAQNGCTATPSDACSPNIGLQLPAFGAFVNTWNVPVNANMNLIDRLLSGNVNLTALSFSNGVISGNITFGGNVGFTGNNTHSGNETFTGVNTVANLDNVIWVDGCSVAVSSPKYACTPAGIQAAITDATANCRPVFIPPSTIAMGNTQITIPPCVKVSGAGMKQTILQWTSNMGSGAIGLTSPVGSYLGNLELSFNSGNTSDAIRITGSDSASALDNTFENILIDFSALGGVGSSGIHATSSGPSFTDIVLNTFRNIIIQTGDQAVLCTGCEGNYWQVVAQNMGAQSGSILFNEIAPEADDILDIRIESGSGNFANEVCLKVAGNNNLVRLTCDGNLTGLTSVNDTGGYNIFDVDTVGTPTLGTIPSTSQYRYVGSSATSNSMGVATLNGMSVPTGTGSVVQKTASGSATIDLASVASGACTADSSDVTLTGASVGDPVRVTAATALPAGVWLIGRVTASNTGRFQLCNLSGGAVDRASDTYTISVVK